jgi:hypothetical protein
VSGDGTNPADGTASAAGRACADTKTGRGSDGKRIGWRAAGTAAVFAVCVAIVFAGGAALRLLGSPTERGPALLGVRVGMTAEQARGALERAGLGRVRVVAGGTLEAEAPEALRATTGVWSVHVELVRGRVAQVDAVLEGAGDAQALLGTPARARDENGVAVVTLGPRVFLVDLRCNEHAARGRALLEVAARPGGPRARDAARLESGTATTDAAPVERPDRARR